MLEYYGNITRSGLYRVRKHFFRQIIANTVFMRPMACNSIENGHFFKQKSNKNYRSPIFDNWWIFDDNGHLEKEKTDFWQVSKPEISPTAINPGISWNLIY